MTLLKYHKEVSLFMYKKLVSLIFVLALLPCLCHANSADFEFAFDSENSCLNVYSSVASCTYAITPYSVDFPVFSSAALPLAANLVKFNDNYANIPLALDSGRYSICFYVRQNGNDEKYLFDFYYPDHVSANSLINQINSASDIYPIVNANAATLGIDSSKFDMRSACNFASQFSPFTESSLYNALCVGNAIAKLKSNISFDDAIAPVSF